MKERDEEIEVVIARFEEESSAAKEQMKRSFEEKLNSVKDKHASQMNEVLPQAANYFGINTFYLRLKNPKKAGRRSI